MFKSARRMIICEFGGELLAREDIAHLPVTQILNLYPWMSKKELGLSSELSYVKGLKLNRVNWFTELLKHLINSMLMRVPLNFDAIKKINWFPDSLFPSTERLIADSAKTLDWCNAWIKCMAYSECGTKLAVAQNHDAVRIIRVGINGHSPILTLTHPQQKMVADLQWRRTIMGTLAVACDKDILIWHLDQQSVSTRPAPSNAKRLRLPFSHQPCSYIAWSHNSNSLYSSSPNSATILVWDPEFANNRAVITSFWYGCGVKNMFAQGNICTAVFNRCNKQLLRVYETSNWSYNTYSNLNGTCKTVCIAPENRCILFATSKSSTVFGLRIEQKLKESSAVAFSVGNEICGIINQIVCSPDENRVVVSYKDCPEIVSVFMCQWHPEIELTLCGNIRGSSAAQLIVFNPKFTEGSLLSVVWSDGNVQHIPLLYNKAIW